MIIFTFLQYLIIHRIIEQFQTFFIKQIGKFHGICREETHIQISYCKCCRSFRQKRICRFLHYFY